MNRSNSSIEMIKHLLRKSKLLIVANSVAKNYGVKLTTDLKIYKSKAGSTHLSLSIDQSVRYIFDVFHDYILHTGIEEGELHGKRILEIGPGDNLGVALLFLAKGARKVTCLEKFHTSKNMHQQIMIYREIRKYLSAIERKRYDNSININNGHLEFNESVIEYVCGYGIEDVDFEDASYDFIVSRAVLEHVYNIDNAFSVMKKALKPGGYMIHKIDLRDHGIFSSSGMHPLTFLTINSKLWKYMTAYCGKPNRRRIDYYRSSCSLYDYDVKIYTTHMLGNSNELVPHKLHVKYRSDYNDHTIKLIKKIRPKLAPIFKYLSDKDLMVLGIFFVAKKIR